MNEVEIKLMSKFKYVDNVRVFENSSVWYLAHHTPKGIKYNIINNIEALASIYFPKKLKKLTSEMLIHLQEFTS